MGQKKACGPRSDHWKGPCVKTPSKSCLYTWQQCPPPLTHFEQDLCKHKSCNHTSKVGEKWGHKMEEEQWIANRYRKKAAANLKADLRVFVYSWVWVLIRLLPPSELIQTDSQGKKERVRNGRERERLGERNREHEANKWVPKKCGSSAHTTRVQLNI